MIDKNYTEEAILPTRVLLVFAAISTVLILGWVLWFSRFGLDITDEGFYLAWMSNPFNFSISVPITQFGFIYHLLYELCDGSIAGMRQANLIITFYLAWLLSYNYLKVLFGMRGFECISWLIISAAISTASFVFLQLWLPTPSYNWLALQALFIVAIGLLYSDKVINRRSILGALLIGVGGWLVFMAKPSTAAALGVIVIFYLVLANKYNFRLFIISLVTAVAFLIISALVIDGSISGFIYRIKGGLEVAILLDAGHNFSDIFRIGDFNLTDRAKQIFVAGIVVFSSAAYFSQSKNTSLMYGSVALTITSFILIGLMIFGYSNTPVDDGHFRGLLLWVVPVTCFVTAFMSHRINGLAQITRENWALTLTFFMLPYAYAFGSNNTYWELSSWAGIFWILAGFVFLTPISSGRNIIVVMLPISLAVQLFSVAIVQTGMESPYQASHPLRINDHEMKTERVDLVISKDMGTYLENVIELVSNAGFEKRTPMIDLTGMSPGVLYVIDATSMGDAWIIGGYPGSNKVAIDVLNRFSCDDLTKAWLFREPDGSTEISSDVLLSFGADLDTDYEVVAMLWTGEGVRRNTESRRQQFLKPIRSTDDAMLACEASRVVAVRGKS